MPPALLSHLAWLPCTPWLQSIDPNHLVTTGEEGYFDEADPQAPANPNDGNMWASRSGQDFRANHAHPAIDYAVMHLWPDNVGGAVQGAG